MKYIATYVLVIVLARFWFWFGTLIVGFPVSGCLAWASERLRGVVAGILSGFGGVAAEVGFGRFMFHLMLGSGAFGVVPLVAATVLLFIPIRKDLAQARVLSGDVAKLRNFPGAEAGFVAMAVGLKFRVVGSLLGLLFTFLWFFLVHENAA